MSLLRNCGSGRRRRVGRPRRRHGGSFLSSIGNALSGAHDWLKRNKIISTVSGALSRVGVPYAGAINTASSALGYGRRRRRVRRRAGGSLKSILSGVHDFVKQKRLISSGLRHFLPNSNLHKAAHQLGYGRRRTRRRPVRRRTTRRRGGSLKSILSNVHKFVKDKRLISSGLKHFMPNSNLHKAAASLGYGRRRRPVRRRAPVRHRGGANFFSTEMIARPKF